MIDVSSQMKKNYAHISTLIFSPDPKQAALVGVVVVFGIRRVEDHDDLAFKFLQCVIQ